LSKQTYILFSEVDNNIINVKTKITPNDVYFCSAVEVMYIVLDTFLSPFKRKLLKKQICRKSLVYVHVLIGFTYIFIVLIFKMVRPVYKL